MMKLVCAAYTSTGGTGTQDAFFGYMIGDGDFTMIEGAQSWVRNANVNSDLLALKNCILAAAWPEDMNVSVVVNQGMLFMSYEVPVGEDSTVYICIDADGAQFFPGVTKAQTDLITEIPDPIVPVTEPPGSPLATSVAGATALGLVLAIFR